MPCMIQQSYTLTQEKQFTQGIMNAPTMPLASYGEPEMFSEQKKEYEFQNKAVPNVRQTQLTVCGTW